MPAVNLMAGLLWLALAIFALVSRERFPRKGMRWTERVLLAGSIALAAVWLAAADLTMFRRSGTAVAAASAITTTATGSCASLRIGMTTDEVKASMGEPDQTRSDEETRGPGSSVLVYGSSRCSVHLFDGRIEFID